MNLILFAQADGPVDGLNFSLINSHHIVRISPEAVVLKLYQRGVSPFDIWQSVSQQDSATGPQRPATAPQWQSQRPAILAPFGGLRLSPDLRLSSGTQSIWQIWARSWTDFHHADALLPIPPNYLKP